MVRPVRMSSAAREWPIKRGRRRVPPSIRGTPGGQLSGFRGAGRGQLTSVPTFDADLCADSDDAQIAPAGELQAACEAEA